MKTTGRLIIAGIIFVFCHSADCQVETLGIKVQGTSKGSYTLTKCDSSIYILYDAKIINNSNRRRGFIVYSCLTSYNFLTDNSHVKICGNNCSSNSLSLIELEPGTAMILPLILKVNLLAINEIDTIRIGFIFLTPEAVEPENFHVTIERLKTIKKQIIWSEPLRFNPTVDKQYEIISLKKSKVDIITSK